MIKTKYMNKKTLNKNPLKRNFSIYDLLKPAFIGIPVFMILSFLSELPVNITMVKIGAVYAVPDSEILKVTHIKNGFMLMHTFLMISACILFALLCAKKFHRHMNYLKAGKISLYVQIFICIIMLTASCIANSYFEYHDYPINIFGISYDYTNPGLASYILPKTFIEAYDPLYMSFFSFIMYLSYTLAMRLYFIKK